MSTPSASDVDARRNVSCFLRRGICSLKFLKLLRSGTCQQSTASGAHHEEHETISLNLASPDENSRNEDDAESSDSGRTPSQESTVDSHAELLVTNAHSTADVVPPRVKFVPLYVHELFPNSEESDELYKPNVTKEQHVFLEGQKRVENECRSCSPKPGRTFLDDVSVDCIDEKMPSDVTLSTDLKVSSISMQYNTIQLYHTTQ